MRLPYFYYTQAKGVMLMNDFIDILTEYLNSQKIFVQNPKRIAEVNAATEMACKLFPKADINLIDDPLQMGAIILTIEDCFVTVREVKKFIDLIGNANNFDILGTEENIKLSILFDNALIKI